MPTDPTDPTDAGSAQPAINPDPAGACNSGAHNSGDDNGLTGGEESPPSHRGIVDAGRVVPFPPAHLVRPPIGSHGRTLPRRPAVIPAAAAISAAAPASAATVAVAATSVAGTSVAGTSDWVPRWWARPWARWVQRRQAAVITAYQRELSRRAARAREELARDGVHLGPVPYGYRLHRRRLEPDPDTALVVGLIFRWRVDQLVGLAEITRILAAAPDRFPPPRRRRRARSRVPLAPVWTTAAVTAIVANPRYTGRQVLRAAYRDTRFSGRRWVAAVLTPDRTHPPLITDDMFCRAQWLIGRPAPNELFTDHWSPPEPPPNTPGTSDTSGGDSGTPDPRRPHPAPDSPDSPDSPEDPDGGVW